MLRRLSLPVLRFARSVATKAEVVDNAAADQVCSQISSEVSNASTRLFAVVYLNGRQWKVTQGDLLSLEGELPLAVGDEINLDKILMVGGANFSVFGRPLLDPSSVSVKATVVEKSTKSPELFYYHNNHQQSKVLHWLTSETTVLRINNVSATGSVAPQSL